MGPGLGRPIAPPDRPIRSLRPVLGQSARAVEREKGSVISLSLTPTTLLVALLSLLWFALVGVIWPHPWRLIPLIVVAAIGGGLLGQAIAGALGGIGPGIGNLQPISVAIGALLAIGVVRRITA